MVAMENRSEGSLAAKNRRERSAAIKPGDQSITCTAKLAVASVNSDVVNHRETTKVADKTKAMKHVGL